jgi:teichuronic acid biosynthesis glycosyltransferase TuaG
MTNQPSVTVIIPFKNNVSYLFSAIGSVFNQSYKNLKLNIIYDNQDRTDLYKIKKFLKNKYKKKSKLVKIEVNKSNLGAGYSRNVGIKKCNSKYIAFLDSDDLWKRNKLQLQIKYMEKNKQVFSHTSYCIIDKRNKIISSRLAKSKIKFEELIKSCDIGLSTVVLNTNFIKKNNFYFSRIKTKEDFVLWLKIAKKIKFITGINKKLTYYRKVANSLSSNKLISIINGYKVYRNYMDYSITKSLYYLIILSINSLKKNLY